MLDYQPSLSAQISHELRIPLTGIVGMVDSLKETRLDYDQRTYVDIIQASAQRLLQLEQKLHQLLS